MAYDPNIHHRHSIRLAGYDYSQAGAYFVTVVTKDRALLFGEVRDSMQLNEFGEWAAAWWCDIPIHFAQVEIDQFVVMPNHIHGIVVIFDADAASLSARGGPKLGQENCAPAWGKLSPISNINPPSKSIRRVK